MIYYGQNQRTLAKYCRGFCMFFALAIVLSTMTAPVECLSQEADKEIMNVNLWISHSTVLVFEQAVTKVIVADPEVADVNVTSPRHVLITGKKIGNTSIIVWGEKDIYYHYMVKVSEKRKKHQIMLQVRFAEMNRGGLQELGAHFIVEQFGSDEETTAGSFAGHVNLPGVAPMIDDNVDFFFSLLTKKPPFHKLTSIIKALEQKRVLTTLAEPNLVAANGEEASFLAGGEFPVPVVQGTAGLQTITIIFKEFGVKLKFTPTILDSSTIKVKVEPEVSSLDFDNGVMLGGYQIPSLLTRKTKTTVELKDGQGIVIGGLLTHEIVETISRIPVLGQIPLLGKLFSSKRLNDAETELIILIIPKIIQPLEPEAIENVILEK